MKCYFLILFLLLLASCQSTPDQREKIKQYIAKALTQRQVFVYDPDQDAEAHEDRVMQCLKAVDFEYPTWEKVGEDEEVEANYVDCPESGLIVLIEHHFKERMINDLNLAKIPQYDE